jgi:hypothetical protein
LQREGVLRIGLNALVLCAASLCLAPRAHAQLAPPPPLLFAPAAEEARPLPPPPSASQVGLLLGAVGAPIPLGIEAFARFHDLLGVGLGVGLLPGALGDLALSAAGISNASLDALSFEGEVRLFPFRGAFFLGGAVGHLGVSAAGKSHGQPVNVDVSTIYVAPRLGWLGIWKSGFTLGLDLGVQLPLSPDVTVTSTSPAQSTLESFARALAALPLPTLSLRVGWLL